MRRPGGWIVLAALALLAGCGDSEAGQRGMHQISKSYAFTVNADPSPPHAREPILYTVTVLDRKTRQLIEGGEGQIFATSRDGANAYDGLEAGREIGTYYANLTFVTSGDWAMGIRFRRDSTHKLERAPDWMQTVLAARDPGAR